MLDLTTKFGRVVKKHLKNEYVIWLTTLDSNRTPQPRHPKIALHFNTDETGDKHVIVFTGEAIIDTDCPPAYKVPAYRRKYKTGIADLNMTLEGFSREYSTAIRIKPTDVRGWE